MIQTSENVIYTPVTTSRMSMVELAGRSRGEINGEEIISDRGGGRGERSYDDGVGKKDGNLSATRRIYGSIIIPHVETYVLQYWLS